MYSSTSNHPPEGIQLLIEITGVDSCYLNDQECIKKTLIEAAEKAGATIVESVIHKFSPFGVSGVIVIAESHIAIHTWPENNYIALDIFTCGNTKIAESIYQNLVIKIGPQKHNVKRIDRQPPQ